MPSKRQESAIKRSTDSQLLTRTFWLNRLPSVRCGEHQVSGVSSSSPRLPRWCSLCRLCHRWLWRRRRPALQRSRSRRQPTACTCRIRGAQLDPLQRSHEAQTGKLTTAVLTVTCARCIISDLLCRCHTGQRLSHSLTAEGEIFTRLSRFFLAGQVKLNSSLYYWYMSSFTTVVPNWCSLRTHIFSLIVNTFIFQK